MDETELNDQALLAAIRRRLMDEISSGGRRSDSEKIVNNVYGSAPGGGGLVDQLYAGQFDKAGPEGEDPYEYMVDIDREDKLDPKSGEKIGWNKKVHRYRKKKVMTE